MLQINHDKEEKEFAALAYDLFNLTEFCTNLELKEAFKAAILSYHTVKCLGGEGDNKQSLVESQAIVTAYTFLKVSRGW